MTLRGTAITIFAVALAGLGWRTGWTELTALGVGGTLFVVVAVVLCGPRAHAAAALDRSSLRVVRGEPASVRLRIDAPRLRRWMRIVEGSASSPRRSVRLRDGHGVPGLVAVPLDTSKRGNHPVGPYLLVHGDPWSIVRRTVHQTEAGSVTVLPRTYPVGRRRILAGSVEDGPRPSRLPGDQHFHALRDYVLGDEPRTVHWRSSARVGHLVVRQQVAAANSGTAVVLDCDITAYGQDDQFGTGWESDRFEAAVEVAASLIVAETERNERAHLIRTTRDASPTGATAGSPAACLDVLAAVAPVPPVETNVANLLRLVRATRCARLIVVTGTPGMGLVGATRRVRNAGLSATVVRVGASRQGRLDGLDVVDVSGPGDLADSPT